MYVWTRVARVHTCTQVSVPVNCTSTRVCANYTTSAYKCTGVLTSVCVDTSCTSTHVHTSECTSELHKYKSVCELHKVCKSAGGRTSLFDCVTCAPHVRVCAQCARVHMHQCHDCTQVCASAYPLRTPLTVCTNNTLVHTHKHTNAHVHNNLCTQCMQHMRAQQ